MDLIVREATLSDAQLIANLTRAAWAGKVAATSSGHRESPEQVRQHLQEGGGFILILGSESIGSVRWLPLDGETNVWEMLRMGLLPQYRGNNLSQHLLEAVIHHAQAANVAELRLAVRADQSRLVDLYAAYDFEVAPELEYSHANPQELVPTVMRRLL
ncbi:MAG: GNAT family N-acetyltransferase [Burkholderiales bacterium]|nr:GNAT family N-acetyltransferase [Burkholderiales bacterium]